MTKEQAVEEILRGGKVECNDCGGQGGIGSSMFGPEQCGSCQGNGFFVKRAWLEAMTTLGRENEIPKMYCIWEDYIEAEQEKWETLTRSLHL